MVLHFLPLLFLFTFIGAVTAVHAVSMDKWPSQVISGDNITLGCSFVLEDDYALANMEVAWHFRSNSHWTVVYYYVNGTDWLVDQDKRFSGRAWIVPKELKEEKASLRISSVRLTDRGEYRCIVIDNGGAAFDSAYLTVLAPYSSPRLTALYGNGAVILHCLSEGGYPQGEVMWHDGRGERLNQSWSREYIKNPDGGVDINSNVSVTVKEFSVVCCSVIHTALQQNRTACEEIKDRMEDKSRNSAVIWFAFGIGLLLCAAIFMALKAEKFRRCHCTKRNTTM